MFEHLEYYEIETWKRRFGLLLCLGLVPAVFGGIGWYLLGGARVSDAYLQEIVDKVATAAAVAFGIGLLMCIIAVALHVVLWWKTEIVR